MESDDKATTSSDSSESSHRANLRLRLANAKAERAEVRDRRESMETASELERMVEEEEQSARDDKALLKAESEHGRNRVASVDTPMGLIILKRPNALHFKRFQDKESLKTSDLDQLVRPCLVHPTSSRFDEILEELPATITRCADRVATLAGVRAKELSGK